MTPTDLSILLVALDGAVKLAPSILVLVESLKRHAASDPEVSALLKQLNDGAIATSEATLVVLGPWLKGK